MIYISSAGGRKELDMTEQLNNNKNNNNFHLLFKWELKFKQCTACDDR